MLFDFRRVALLPQLMVAVGTETPFVHSEWQGTFLMSLVSANGELSPISRAESMVTSLPSCS